MASLDQLLPQLFIQQQTADAAADVEDVFRIDVEGSFAQHFRQRRNVRGQHRRAVRHGFQRGQAEAFVERGEGEGSGAGVEHTQGLRRDEAQEAHVVLRAALDDGAAELRVLGELVADDDQFQVAIVRVVTQLVLDQREGFNQAGEVFAGRDVAGVKKVGVVGGVAAKCVLDLVRGRMRIELRVHGVVHDFNLVGGQAELADEVAAGGMGDAQDAVGAAQAVADAVETQQVGERGAVGREGRKGRGVMHSNDVRAGDHPTRSQVGCVPHVHLAAAQLPGETQVVAEAVRAAVEDEQLEIVRQAAEDCGVGVAADQEVRGGGVQPGQGLH